MTGHSIILGDSRDMPELADRSVHLVVTSPPYWQLKDYGPSGQIGFDDSYEDYINNLNLVWHECYRVLHNGCRLCVVIGDQFARSVYYGRYKIIPIRTEIIKFCEAVGFDYMGAIVWQKITTCNTSGGAIVMGSYPYPRNGIVKLDYEWILLFKKGGEPPRVDREVKERSKLSREEWNTYFAGHWRIPGERQDKHLAVFPEEVPRRLIRMFSFAGETVLDPFLGSGTTSLAARKCHRNSVGYEINERALPLIERRMGIDGLLREGTCEVTRREKQIGFSREEKIARFPYIFRDPVQVSKRIDPKARTFGSKIEAGQPHKGTFYTVKEVLSPEKLVLSNGLQVKLLGIRENGTSNKEAVDFLRTLTKSQRVFLRFDINRPDDDDGVRCYLYLRNRTFVNAHLIKSGLVDVDTSIEYSKKKQFLRSASPCPLP